LTGDISTMVPGWVSAQRSDSDEDRSRLSWLRGTCRARALGQPENISATDIPERHRPVRGPLQYHLIYPVTGTLQIGTLLHIAFSSKPQCLVCVICRSIRHAESNHGWQSSHAWTLHSQRSDRPTNRTRDVERTPTRNSYKDALPKTPEDERLLSKR
jgi:hypothetical protein